MYLFPLVLRRLFLIALICTVVIHSKAQSINQSSSVLFKMGRELYSQQRYAEAQSIFEQLVANRANDPQYNFYLGRCLMDGRIDVFKSVECFEKATIESELPEVWFYMSKAALYSFQFEKSIKAMRTFQQMATATEIREFNAKYWIERTEYADRLTRDAVGYTLLQRSEFPGMTGFANAMGRVVEKPIRYKTALDLKAMDTSFMFENHSVSHPDYTYFSGFGSLKVKGRELFRVDERSNEGVKFENLGEMINTVYDEDYPFFDYKNNTLYYSSKGRNSMGGYDIFKTVYDRRSQTWSTPENLGFPINTPYDDYFFLLGPDGKTATFVSDRELINGNPVLYQVHLPQNNDLQYEYRPAQLMNIALWQSKTMLASKSETVVIVEPEPVPVRENVAVVNIPVITTDEAKANSPQQPPVVVFDEASYSAALQTALVCQVKADSISRLITIKRQRLISTSSPAEKNSISNELLKLELDAARFQVCADQNYAKVRAMEQSQQTANQPVLEKREINSDSAQIFAILPQSPYSDRNPFSTNESLPSGVFYRIQLGAFSISPAYNKFGGMTPISIEVVGENKITKCYVGRFTKSAQAEVALKRVRAAGFPDAFIVSYFNNKRLPLERVREIETSGL